MEFSDRVFQARKAKGFSQEELAALVGVSRQAVSKWETGEAMPDMEKLVALCNALDQNMEYLALGKSGLAPKETPRKAIRWLTPLLAVVFLAVGFLGGYACSGMRAHTAGEMDAAYFKADLGISNVQISAVPSGQLDVAILPAILPEGMEIQVLCEDRILNQTQTHSCTLDGNFYRVSFVRPEKYRYYLTAVLTYKGIKKQMPLLEIDGDGLAFSAIHLWEGSQ